MKTNEYYCDYNELEEIKRGAWKVINSDSSAGAKAAATLNLITAHYWRARHALERKPKSFQRRIHGKRYSPGYQLDIDVYTRHWLWANGEMLVAPEVLDVIRDVYSYAPEASRFLPKGQTDYMLEHLGKKL